MTAVRHLEFVGGSRGTATAHEGPFVMGTLVPNFVTIGSNFQVVRICIFCRSGLNVPCQFVGLTCRGLIPQFARTSINTLNALPCVKRHVLIHYYSLKSDAPFDLCAS